VQVIGVGLPRTGTRSLAEALTILGYRTLHYAPDLRHDRRWPRVFDGYDAATDYPCSGWWPQLLGAYPEALVILTVRRQLATWVASMGRHIGACRVPCDRRRQEAEAVHTCLSGEPYPSAERLAAAYTEHTARVLAGIDADRLLILAVDGEGQWDVLCTFLDRPLPGIPFPWLNRGETPETAPQPAP